MQQLPIETVPFGDIELATHGLRNGRTSLGEVGELRTSIENNGLDVPPIVWKTEDDDGEPSYVLIAGYRRHAAITKIREDVFSEAFEELSVSVFSGPLEEAQGINLEENIQRKDLNPADEAEAVSDLYERVGDQTDVGKLLGKSQGWVSQRVNMYKGLIPRGMDYLRAGTINLTVAQNISKLLNEDGTPDEDAQNQALDKIDEGDEPGTRPTGAARAKTYRTKKEFAEMEHALATAEDEGVSLDPTHKAAIERCIAWQRCQIEMDALIYDQINVDDEDIGGDDFVDLQDGDGGLDFEDDEFDDNEFDEDE
jgi:ParB/RepB/Spo0J family partition protein